MRWLALILSLLLLTSCAPVTAPAVEAGLTLKIKLYDESTKEPLEGIVYWWPYSEWMGYHGEDIVGLGIHGIDLGLGASEDGWLAVVVPGYEPLYFRVQYDGIGDSRALEMPVWMVPVASDGDQL